MNIKMKKFKIKLDTKIITKETPKKWFNENINTSKMTNADMHWLTMVKKLPAAKNLCSEMYNLYKNFEGEEIDLSLLDFSRVTQMYSMFDSCINIKKLDLSKFNTLNVTTMNNMFYNCENLTELDVSSFNTSNVTTMKNMFYGCNKITSLDVSNFNTSKVTNMDGMFFNKSRYGGIGHLENIIFGKDFNTENVTSMIEMFNSCVFTNLDVSSFNTQNVKSMKYMFIRCEKLESLDLSNFNTENVTNMEEMFGSCQNLKNLNLSSFDFSKLTGKYNYYSVVKMFNGCKNLTNLFFGKNLGKGYVVTSNNSSNCTLDISNSSLLTHESLLSVIEGLYDLNLTYNTADGGTLYTQKLVLGTTNKAKLTDEEIAIATAKGWIIS